MSQRVNTTTMVCTAHSCHACIVCMCDDFHDWLDARREFRQRYKREWRETPIGERYDLGGEG